MKKIFIILSICFYSLGFGQGVVGTWYGQLSIQGVKLSIVFHISKNGEEYQTSLDSPDQQAFGLKANATTFNAPEIWIDLKNLGASFSGKLKESTIDGTFTQYGNKYALSLSQDSSIMVKKKKSQEPLAPFPYRNIEVSIPNKKDKLTLAGTLSLPQNRGKYPALIFISGSGAQDRNEEILGHKPFLVLADYITKQGFAVLRFDDRGFGKSTGNFSTATSADFANDVRAAFAFLSKHAEIDANKIGLLGHSEGGLIAPMVASTNKRVAFVVLLAAPGLRGDQLLLIQQEDIARSQQVTEAEIEQAKTINSSIFSLLVNDYGKNDNTLKDKLVNYINQSIDADTSFQLPPKISKTQFVTMQVQQLLNPWMRYFICYDPVPALKKLKCPVLAINGEKDIQVAATKNLSAIETAVKSNGNQHVQIEQIPNLNHLFQTCQLCTIEEYGELDETFSPTALERISSWLLKTIKQ
jgi:hypothetical protein